MPTLENISVFFNEINVLFLDDDNMRHDLFMLNHAQPGVTIHQAWTALSAIECLTKMEKYNFVFLDHDLAAAHYSGEGYDKSGTGMDVVDFMCSEDFAKDKWPDVIIVHSWNFYRAKEMTKRLKDKGFNVIQKEFEAIQYFKMPEQPNNETSK